MSFETFPVFIERKRNVQVLAGNAQANAVDFPELWVDQQNVVLHIDLINADGTPVTDLFNLNDTFSLAIAEDFDHGTTVLSDTDDSGFNVPAHRSDLDVVNGKISVLLNGFKTEFIDFLDKKREEILNVQIKVFNVSETNQKKVMSFFINGKNVLERGALGPGEPVENFFTKAETLALIAVLKPIQTNNIDFKVSATHDLLSVPTDAAYIIDDFSDRTDTISGSGTPHSFKLITDLGPTDLTSIILSDSNSLNTISRVSVQHGKIIVPPGTKIQAVITDPSTFTTHEGRFVLHGRLVDA